MLRVNGEILLSNIHDDMFETEDKLLAWFLFALWHSYMNFGCPYARTNLQRASVIEGKLTWSRTVGKKRSDHTPKDSLLVCHAQLSHKV